MTETAEATSNQTRKRLKKGGLALVGVAAIGALATLTASQWSDTATVEGDVTTGNFEIAIVGTDLGFDDVVFAPGVSATYNGVLTNSSTETADITLSESDFPEAFEVTVTAEGTDMLAGGEIELAPDGDSADVTITFTLPAGAGEEAEDLDEEASFTFLGEQQITGDGDGDDGDDE